MFSFSHRKLYATSLISLMTLCSVLFTLPANAHPPGPHSGWFWDGPGHGHGPFLPDGVAFAVIAGITYAIVDGQYYRHQGNQYIYVGDKPTQPSQTTVVFNSSNNNTHSITTTDTNDQDTLFSPGTIVSELPGKSKKVTINHRQYFVSHHTWFVKLASPGYVVVKAQL
ncbi:MAG: hypothetical protein CENE_01162 [Candidatus Celerinatantimonas neptuna]|nr:MAG: hypothetical protein CENE_01162 [Candidatus Celerinatantimonas neptuna]